MAKTVLENDSCAACGTEVRPQALFCYHCGGPVAEIEPETGGHDEKAVEPAEETPQADTATDKPIPNPFLKAAAESKPNGKAAIRAITATEKGDIKLRSAASLRNRARNLDPHLIEIIWEEHDESPNVWFLVVAGVVVIMFILIFLLAMYLK